MGTWARGSAGVSGRTGFSLIELLIVIAVMGVAMSGLVAVFTHATKFEAYANSKQEMRDLSAETFEILKETSCGAPDFVTPLALTDRSWGSSTYYNLPSGIENKSLKIKPNSTYLNRLKIQSVQIGPYFNKTNMTQAYVPMNGDAATATLFKASLYVVTQAVGQDQIVPARFPMAFPIYITVDQTAGTMNTCQAENVVLNAEANCLALGGSWDPGTKCSIGCPAGFVSMDEECVPASSVTNTLQCSSTQRCGAHDRYVF